MARQCNQIPYDFSGQNFRVEFRIIYVSDADNFDRAIDEYSEFSGAVGISTWDKTTDVPDTIPKQFTLLGLCDVYFYCFKFPFDRSHPDLVDKFVVAVPKIRFDRNHAGHNYER